MTNAWHDLSLKLHPPSCRDKMKGIYSRSRVQTQSFDIPQRHPQSPLGCIARPRTPRHTIYTTVLFTGT
ncbi:hypothetical protein Mapa_001109 [Marchantia paleacea]|nr:hypothetical protein Mapa_001109 [Marchantia paleacea]